MTTGPGLPAPFRCSAASLAAMEPLAGTASTVGTFLLLESPGPWGVDALHHGRLDAQVRARLHRLEREGVRPLLVRRPGRRGLEDRHGVRAFWARASADPPELFAARLEDARDLLDLDLAPAVAAPSGFVPHPGPLFGVCTHGRHDRCCAELGRPLAAALADAAPQETWEVSHMGGDRFAPNVLVLPHGLYYGRLLPAEADDFVATHRAGRLDLEHLRGRSSYPFAVQAAEVHLRRQLAVDVVGALRLLSRSRDGEVTTAVFAVGGQPWRVRVRTRRAEATLLTCRSTAPSTALSHTPLEIEPLSRRTGAPA